MGRRRNTNKSAKVKRRRSAKPHRPTAHRQASYAPVRDLQAQLEQRNRELNEALEQQAATGEVLKVISASAGELEPVFDAMLQNAVRLCEASFGNLLLYDGNVFRHVALHNAPPAWAAERERDPVPPRETARVLYSVAETKQVAHVADIAVENPDEPIGVIAGARTLLVTPMLKERELIGAIAIYRLHVCLFSDKQIELLQNFAAQAVIAIDNARLLNELRHRTSDLTEALEHQTATAEVLSVISGSPGDLKPVFQAILANATRICEAHLGTLLLCEGEFFRIAALHGPPDFAEWWSRNPVVRPGPGTAPARAALTRQPVRVADLTAEPAYASRDPLRVNIVERGGARTLVSVPMLKDNQLVGTITIYRQEVRPFTDKNVELVQNFAAQAVIAIENARLLRELRQRTDDLSEALEQQTATSEVLKVVSGSPGDLAPVFQSMLVNATRICEAAFGTMVLYENGRFRRVALHNPPFAYAEHAKKEPYVPEAKLLAAILEHKHAVHVDDMATESPESSMTKLGGARTLLNVPMLKENELIGVIGIYRHEVRPFTPKQVELVQNFAAQAVIAIENTRLLKELREKTEQVSELNQRLERRVADQVGEIERMGRLRRFLPPQVADLIVASGDEQQLKSHRREITALFCDLRGFTGFAESSDPEDVIALLHDYHAAIGGLVIKYNGTLERYAGDGVMVVFNDPMPIDNPALQAVLMALDIRDAIGTLIEKWRRLGHDIGFGIGIAHGFATLGTIGFEGRYDYAAIGTVSNVASRLCDEARPGQILISPRVLMAVENSVTVDTAGEFTLKGISRPMTAYNVLGTTKSAT
jgi:class 3 adenylate cyclase/putative methionine-R-sulfoxide reductase with GAF domain